MTSSENQEATITADVKLSVAGQSLNLRLTVPVGQTKPTRLLPVLRSISESLVNAVETRARAEGFQVSCKKGCGACCRQLVPISETDARRLRELVAEMPEARKTAVLARFEDAKERIGAAGLLERLRTPESIVGDEFRKFGLNYFHQGVACPFLEEESCSIHQERPLVCREYLVVSPPENCARQTNEPVQVLSMPAEVSMAARRLGRGAEEVPVDHWVPLILALDWADAHGEEPSRPGPEIVKEIFAGLVKKEVPPPSND
jgi:Fe-S-cluster containining protein